jgi:hypothetical protein
MYVRGFLTHGAPAPPRLAGVLSALFEVGRECMWNNYHRGTEKMNLTYLKYKQRYLLRTVSSNSF